MNEWTRDLPTQPGFYWLSTTPASDPEVVDVQCADDEPSYFVTGHWERRYFSHLGVTAEWCGPLRPPPRSSSIEKENAYLMAVFQSKKEDNL